MDGIFIGLFIVAGTVAFFAFCAFAVWADYRKKKDEREAARDERMKALEMGYPPADAEIARVQVDASAVWAAGLIGFLVPLALIGMTGTITIIIVVNRINVDAGFIAGGLTVTGVVSLVAILRSLKVISERRSPRPERPAVPEARRRGSEDLSPAEFREKRPG